MGLRIGTETASLMNHIASRQTPVPWTRILGGDKASALSIAEKRSIKDFDLWMLDGSKADRVAKVRGGEVLA